MTPRPPSGRQTELRRGDWTATVTEVGAVLRTLERAGEPVLDGFAEDEMCHAARGTPLLPWPNRIAGGSYRFGGADLQLAITEPERGTAIHGLSRWANWTVARHDGGACTMELALPAQAGYPFRLDLAVEYALDGAGVTVTTTARNVGDEPCPYGAGYHPYVTVGEPHIDTAVLEMRAATVLDADDRGIPNGGRRDVAEAGVDFRSPRPIGSTRIDSAFTDLDRDAGGTASVWMRRADGGRTVRVWMDARHTHVMLFTGDTLPEPHRRTGLGVEPMTCPPNAFASGDGVIVLEPGEEVTSRWGIAVQD